MYLPLLNLAPAEMLALESLPERDKDELRVVFPLRKWLTSKSLSKSFDRISKANGQRPSYLLPPDLPLSEADDAGVALELRPLLSPRGGYDAWCSFFEADQGSPFIPTLQLNDASQFDAQAARLIALGRGALVHVPRSALQFIDAIAARTAQHTGGGADVVFLIDLGRQSKNLLLQEAELHAVVARILARCSSARVAVSCSTFPPSFGETRGQEIYERTLFQQLRRHFGNALVYSDRGSARAEMTGGGGTPYPRIDYPLGGEWRFFRTEEYEAFETGYRKLAAQLMSGGTPWDPAIRIWGTQMIEKTRLGDRTGITSPARSTAVRINLHLHRQLWYDDPDRLYETDDDWNDI